MRSRPLWTYKFFGGGAFILPSGYLYINFNFGKSVVGGIFRKFIFFANKSRFKSIATSLFIFFLLKKLKEILKEHLIINNKMIKTKVVPRRKDAIARDKFFSTGLCDLEKLLNSNKVLINLNFMKEIKHLERKLLFEKYIDIYQRKFSQKC